MTAHPDNHLFRALKAMALDVLETEARNRWPDGAKRGGLFVLYRVPYGAIDAPAFDLEPTFSYQWGDVCVSRNEAGRRLEAI